MSGSSDLVRVKEGAVVCGVCKGLEVSGQDSAKGALRKISKSFIKSFTSSFSN